MATAAPPTPPLTWATFAITEVRWLKHAIAWAVVLWAIMAYLPWLVSGFHVVVELALLAAIATASSGREVPAPPPAVLIRYALVDAVFVALAAPWLIVPMQAALSASGLMPAGPHVPPMIPIAVFVLAFYTGLGIMGRAGAVRLAPLTAACVLGILLVAQGYRPAVEYSRQQAERQAGVAGYERATGRAVEERNRLAIGNSLHGFEHRVAWIEQDARGRVLVAGGFSYYAGRDARGFVRLAPDGRLDPSFATLPPGDPVMLAPSRFRIAADGSIVAHQPHAGLARLQEDGAVDTRFRPELKAGAGERQAIEAFDVAPDASIVVASPTRFLGGPEDRCVLRLNPDGTHDTAFESAAMQSLFGVPATRATPCSVHSLTVLAQGRVLVGGAFPYTNARPGLVRLNADGTLDKSFQPRVDLTAVSVLHVTPLGEVFGVSYLPVPGSSPAAYRVHLVKLLASGELDAGFTVPGESLHRIEALAAQPGGRLVVAGSRGPSDHGAIVRLTPQGRIDPAFGGGQGAPRVDGFVTALRVQADGRIVLGGEFREIRHGARKVERHNIARLLADGALDTTFDPR